MTMSSGIYVSATTPGSGKTLVSLGLADALHRRADRIGFFRPITSALDPEADPTVAMLRRMYQLDPQVCRAGMSSSEARALMAAGRREDIDSRAVEIFSDISKHADVIIVEGTDLTGQDAAVEFDLNARLANNLGLPMLAVVGARGLSAEEIADAVDVARKELAAERCSLLAVMVNRADPDNMTAIATAIRPGNSHRPVYVIPEIPEISRPTVGRWLRPFPCDR